MIQPELTFLLLVILLMWIIAPRWEWNISKVWESKLRDWMFRLSRKTIEVPKKINFNTDENALTYEIFKLKEDLKIIEKELERPIWLVIEVSKRITSDNPYIKILVKDSRWAITPVDFENIN